MFRVVDWARPLRIWQLSVLALLGALITATITTIGANNQSIFSWAPPTWVETFTAWRDASYLSGILLTLIGAAISTEVRTPRIIGGLGHSRTGTKTVLRHLSRMSLALMIGASLVLIPTLIYVSTRATAGQFDVLSLVNGYLTLVFWLVLGYAVGSIIPGGWALLVAGVFAFLITVIPTAIPNNLLVLFPVYGFTAPTPGSVATPIAGLLRFVWFSTLNAALVAATSAWTNRQLFENANRFKLAASAFIPALGVLAVVVAIRPLAFQPEIDPPLSCAVRGEIEVCVHQALSTLLTPTSESVFAVTDTAVVTKLKVIDRSLVYQFSDADIVTESDNRIGSVSQRDSAAAASDIWATETAYGLTYPQNCWVSDEGTRTPIFVGQGRDPERAGMTIAHVLATRSGYPFLWNLFMSVNFEDPDDPSNDSWYYDTTLADELLAMDDEAFAEWYQEHLPLIRTCAMGDFVSE